MRCPEVSRSALEVACSRSDKPRDIVANGSLGQLGRPRSAARRGHRAAIADRYGLVAFPHRLQSKVVVHAAVRQAKPTCMPPPKRIAPA